MIYEPRSVELQDELISSETILQTCHQLKLIKNRTLLSSSQKTIPGEVIGYRLGQPSPSVEQNGYICMCNTFILKLYLYYLSYSIDKIQRNSIFYFIIKTE